MIPLPAFMKRFPLLLLALWAISAAGADAPLSIAVIPMGTTHEFWKTIHAGAMKAQHDLGAEGRPITVLWVGPLREDNRGGQVEVVEDMVARHVSGIVLSPIDDRALVAPVEDAVNAHIPVVIFGSTLRSDKYSSFISTDNREGGRLAGRRLGALLHGSGKVILLRIQVGSAAGVEREEGFLEVMRRDFPGIDLISTEEHGGATRDTAFTASENLLGRFGQEVTGIFTPNESTTVGMLLALRESGLNAGKIKFVGFDASGTLVDAVKSGEIQGLVVQDPFMIGYLSVKAIVAVLHGEKTPANVATRLGFVTRENLNDPEIVEMIHPPLDQWLK